MQNDRIFRRWRRVDEPGLELMALSRSASGISVRSTLILAGEESFGLRYRWELDPSWRTRTLRIDRTDAVESRSRSNGRATRAGGSMAKARPDLDGCHEVDVSATPFCNGLAIRRFGEADGEWLALFVEASVLTCQPSRQRYEHLGPRAWRYVDKGVSDGFTARLDLDEEGLVAKYEHLFEAFWIYSAAFATSALCSTGAAYLRSWVSDGTIFRASSIFAMSMSAMTTPAFSPPASASTSPHGATAIEWP